MRDRPAGRVLGCTTLGSFLFLQHQYPTSVLKERHSHPWLHLALVQEGVYSRIEGSRRVDFRPGSLAFLESGKSHADRYASGSRCLHIVIPSELECRLSRDFRTGVGEVWHTVAAPASLVLQREFLFPNDASPLIVEMVLLDLISRHMRIVCERSALRPAWMGSLMEYLNDTFEEDWTLKKIAATLGIHPVHLCRTFSQHQNCTLGAYIQDLRLMRGWQLLALSRDSLAQIAANCGFADQSHFTRSFKNRFGITPGAFRHSAVPTPSSQRTNR